MLKSTLYDCSNAYILVKGTIEIIGRGADQETREADGRNKSVILTNSTSFTDFISDTNNI